MIKLIACDLDGTLLKKDGSLPEGVFDVVTPLCERGVLFIPASGRQYESLKRLFSPIADRAVFLCENGALVKYLGRSIYLNPLDLKEAKTVIEIARNTEGVYPIYCGETTAYIENGEEPFFSRVTRPYPSYRLVENLDAVIGKEPCCKISLFSTQSAETQAYAALQGKLKNASITLSGGHWCDIAAPTANKGTAIQEIQRIFKIKKEECAAFGDHMNDEQLLNACGYPFVPENAYPKMKTPQRTLIPSNEENGVLQTLLKLEKQGVLS
ncbi:MAG: HAD family phosphatase [Clostridia bacterium]|nr:HAD family phosphatase [Clostridia bacterium]